ncbi:hypothetical protein HMPREF1248_0773 [Coriobacteriaceae bacterium BV3Ac1]|nr:hypothetical protein HMPREF1248_0773 [Coriobacteriaceae bacterium BV3Ac1]
MDLTESKVSCFDLKSFSEWNTAAYVHQESGITPENMAVLLHLCRVL